MSQSYLWTAHGCRLELKRTSQGKSLNWLFLPGGPGLGSEVLSPLTSILKLPGSLWHLDLPGDGSNKKGSFQDWQQALVESVNGLDNVILVGHSRGGMFALATGELQKALKGVVLLDTAPDRGWQDQFAKRIHHFPLPPHIKTAMDEREQAYQNDPTNATLKEFVLAGASYMFTPAGLEKGAQSLKHLPYNHHAIEWTLKHFDPTYEAAWVPEEIPTLILSGEHDLATPLKLFSEKKEYRRSNIVLKEIKNAGHFPWIENPVDVTAAFNEFAQRL